MIYSFSPFGYDGSIINIEVDLRRGIPAVDIVGLADSSVKESRDRIRSAIHNQGLEFPPERVLISLSPADIKKEGAGFDLPLAMAVLEAQYNLKLSDSLFVMGELDLSGSVRDVRSVTAGLQTAFAQGIGFAIIPKSKDLVIPKGIKVREVETLSEAFTVMSNLAKGEYSDFTENTETEDTSFKVEFSDDSELAESFDNLKHHDRLKFAMAVAVAGRHNLIAWGSPGCGKTMTLQMMPLLMPKLTYNESVSVDRIYSIAGLGKRNGIRPFRMPHQTASIEGICGGGCQCRPGEITLAHNGVLFLDEAAEFRSSVLQMLRVPIETQSITLSRAGRYTVFPAKFQLIMAVNPCPCGNLGNKERVCLCSGKSIEQYWLKFSAPLLDRIGIRFDNNLEDSDDMNYQSLACLRLMIKQAWERQYARQGKLNQDLTPEELSKIRLSEKAKSKLDNETLKRNLSSREVANIIKIAKTHEDMLDRDEAEEISLFHMEYALKIHGKLPLQR